MSNWRAIQCLTQREAMVRDNLEAIGVTCFFPYRWVRNSRQHKITWLKRAYFPGYLFADLEHHRPLGTIIGLERVLGETDLPEPIIDALKSLADPDGLVQEPPLTKGDNIRLGNVMVEIGALDERIATVLFPIFGQLWPSRLPVTRLLSMLQIAQRRAEQ